MWRKAMREPSDHIYGIVILVEALRDTNHDHQETLPHLWVKLEARGLWNQEDS